MGAWVAAPLPGTDLDDTASGGDGGENEDEAGVDERQLAKDDPAAGFLHMQASLKPAQEPPTPEIIFECTVKFTFYSPIILVMHC